MAHTKCRAARTSSSSNEAASDEENRRSEREFVTADTYAADTAELTLISWKAREVTNLLKSKQALVTRYELRATHRRKHLADVYCDFTALYVNPS